MLSISGNVFTENLLAISAEHSTKYTYQRRQVEHSQCEVSHTFLAANKP